MPITPPEFSVLLLAWDDADPTVAVLGGAALPPTRQLVYQLATQQPVLAIYPHLPAGDGTVERAAADSPIAPVATVAAAVSEVAAVPSGSAAVADASEVAVDALTTAVDGPGVQVLPTLPLGKQTTVPALQSRIIGLAELESADTAEPVASSVSAAPAKPLTSPLPLLQPAPSHSQWPTGIHAPALAGQWQTPAAPYLGAGSGGFFPPPPPAPPRPLVSAKSPGPAATVISGIKNPNKAAAFNGAAYASAAIPTPTASLRPQQNPQAGDLRFDPDPELPAVQHPAAFQETTEEIGAGEAADISAPEDDLVPNSPVAAAETEVPEVAPAVSAPTPAAPEPVEPVVLTPRLNGLNFRMIQYARQAAQLVQGRAADFGVIYAPNWPAWLAALEIRNSSGRPLVLYLASLATDLPNPAEHGYQLEMERMAMRRARLVLVPDEALRHRLMALYEDTADKVRVVAAGDETAVQKALGEVALG